ncbi:hypothetical protein CEXT_684801, partial [Caerostris extrusa]
MVLCVSTGTGHRRHPCHVPEPRRAYAEPRRHRHWDGGEGTPRTLASTPAAVLLSAKIRIRLAKQFRYGWWTKVSQDPLLFSTTLEAVAGRQAVSRTHDPAQEQAAQEGGGRENLGMRSRRRPCGRSGNWYYWSISGKHQREGSVAGRIGRIQPYDEIWPKSGMVTDFEACLKKVADIISNLKKLICRTLR